MHLRCVRLALIATIAMASSIASTAAPEAECFMLARQGRPAFVSDSDECGHPTAPASTFKIPHALIALETGVITADTIFRWDGSSRANESWQRDHTLDSAIKWSVLPFFQNTARLIGPERMHRGLARLKYARDSFDGDISTFWLNGDLVVSPVEQLAFLERFFGGQLPVSAQHVASVQRAMQMPTGQVLMAAGPHRFDLSWPADTVVRTKTGNTTVMDERVSWVIGALEVKRERYLFVARVRRGGSLDTSAAIDLAQRELNAHRPPF
ncbi:MAG TPA: penicillin-binding transpeptidase domain-containing protein, partial [Vicinamibacterales bacterium]|nr:penicillin-binding transpeptidase domain-containing protein [Vicinamibacterales bacterium]